jgi:hypothetical protein
LIQKNNHGLSLEQELVLAAITLDQSKDDSLRAMIAATPDWSTFFDSASRHGVLPLCCQRIIHTAKGQLPTQVAEQCEKALRLNIQNNIRLAWKLVECVETLSESGIECIVLKGPVLALQAYGDLSSRQFSDLDILIHQDDFSKAYDLLLRSGYAPAADLDRKTREYQVRSDNQFTFNQHGFVIEIHWEIAPRIYAHPLNPEQMWQGLQSIKLLDKDINVLSSNSTILLLCLHGAKHGWKQLKWIIDLAYLGRTFSEDAWLTLLENAKTLGLFRQVCLGLLLAERLAGAQWPSKVHDLINTDYHAQHLAFKVEAGLFRHNNKTSLFEDHKFYVQTREHWQNKFFYLFHLIFVPRPRDWHTFSLPEHLYSLYFFYRPVRLFFKEAKSVIAGLK